MRLRRLKRRSWDGPREVKWDSDLQASLHASLWLAVNLETRLLWICEVISCQDNMCSWKPGQLDELLVHVLLKAVHKLCLKKWWGFPGGTVGKNLPVKAEDTRDASSIPGLGRYPGVGNSNTHPVLLFGKFHGQRSLVGYSPRGHKESDTTERQTATTNY